MNNNRTSRVLLVAIGLALGLIIGGAAMYAHFKGTFTPLYQAFGLHGDASDHVQAPTSTQGQTAHNGHNHGGAATESSVKVPGYALVTVPADRQQLIGVRTGRVTKDDLVMSIRTVGIIEPDQTRLAQLHTRVSGWVTKVHINFVGQQVKKGDPLIELYSPDLVIAQAGYAAALESLARQPDSEPQRQLADAARRKLELWGVPAEEIKRLAETHKAQDTLLLRAPIDGRVLQRNVLEGSYVEPAMELYQIADLSKVWLQAKVYEHELPHVEINQPVRITLPSQPGEAFEGKVSFIEPVLQEMTRTVKVRVEIDNPRGLFKPGMYADIELRHDMGQGLLVAESAALRTGERGVVFRALGGGRFEPVEVKLGSRFGDRYQVLAGLSEGDEVVTSGNFLIDSDSRLKAASGAMGHSH